MRINWKQVAQSPGYTSMKAAVADEAKRVAKWNRKPDERYAESFNFAINRAKHYAHVTGESFINILNGWEEKRDLNFMNYYTNHHFPKLHGNSAKPLGLRASIKEARRERGFYNKEINGRVCSIIIRHNAIKQKKRDKYKDKPRWTPEYKNRRKNRGY